MASTIHNDELLQMVDRPLGLNEWWVIQAPDGDIFPRTASKIMAEPPMWFAHAFSRPDRPITWMDCERQGFRVARAIIRPEDMMR